MSAHLECGSSLYRHGLTQHDKDRISEWLTANGIDEPAVALTLHPDGGVDVTTVVRGADGRAVITSDGDEVVTRQVSMARPEPEFPHLDWQAIAMATADRADSLHRSLSVLHDAIRDATRGLHRASFRATEFGRSREQRHEEKR